MEAVAAFREQARACAALGSPMYAGLLEHLADDLAAGGPTAAVLAGHEDDSGPSALALRLLGSVHRLVLERRAGGLAAYYPSVGGAWEVAAGSAAFVEVLDQQPQAVREWLDRPPQTNEVGRAAALYGGLLHLPAHRRLPVRLHEIGSSGGLNLLADRFGYVDGRGDLHGTDGPVRLDPAWGGNGATPGPAPWPDLRFVERVGCDPMPVDVTTTEGRLTLTAYVWPDQPARHERLRGALALAQQEPPRVLREAAADFAERIELRPGALTVLWHSVMWQYLSHDEQDRVSGRIERLGQAADEDAPFVHLRLEPSRRSPGSRHEFLVQLTAWPGGERRVLGRAAPHGVPVDWDA